MRTVIAVLCVFLVACGGANSSTPSPVVTTPSFSGFEGLWTGSTGQGAQITVAVSADQKVTSITLGYVLGGCSGVKMFQNLAQNIQPLTTPDGTRYDKGFAYGTDDGRNVTQIFGGFTSNTLATGLIVVDYSGCGSGLTNWTATRR